MVGNRRKSCDQLIATQVNIFGELMQEYFAPEDGIVIGHCVNPMGQTGARIMHLVVLMSDEGRQKFMEVSGCALDDSVACALPEQSQLNSGSSSQSKDEN